ncbi:response regulator [Patescibacteria group bacterium]|nr:response regulator [Patescibacteria group bacterium]
MMDKNIKILVADDSAFMRKVLMHILENAGFTQFLECGNGDECYTAMLNEKPDLVLLDVIMPEVTGIDLLKKFGGALNSNVIVVSAVGQESMVNDAKKMGAKGYIIKPFDQTKVIDEIERVLN